MRKAAAAIALTTIMVTAAPASAGRDVPAPVLSYVTFLSAGGYTVHECETTWLGRLRILAEKDGVLHELILSRSGKVMRSRVLDFAINQDTAATTPPPAPGDAPVDPPAIPEVPEPDAPEDLKVPTPEKAAKGLSVSEGAKAGGAAPSEPTSKPATQSPPKSNSAQPGAKTKGDAKP